MCKRCMFVFLLAAALPACGDATDDPELTADFVGATPAELRTVIEVSLGANAGLAFVSMLGAEIDAHYSHDACPSHQHDGTTMTLSATGCVTEGGTRYDGQLVATNAITLSGSFSDDPGVDPYAPMSIEFDGFSVDATGSAALLVSGRIDQSSPVASPYRSDTSLALTLGDQTVDERLSVSCVGHHDDDIACEIRSGWFSVGSLGSFTVEGVFGRRGGSLLGTLTMHGLQDMRISLGESSCHDFSIGDDGSDMGQICWD